MKKIDFNGNWRYCREGGSFSPVTLPFDAMLHERRSAQAEGGKNVAWFEGGNYRFERPFSLDKRKDCRYVLEFEGVYRNAEVFLNGTQVCSRPYGYTCFSVDVTKELMCGENLLAVTAKNADQPNSRFYSGAGLYRPVWLYEFPARHILLDGVRIVTLDARAGLVEVSVKTSHGGGARVWIYDGERLVASGEGERVLLTVGTPRLWSPEDPHLYTCRVEYFGDAREIPFGIRDIRWSAKEGFLLNGVRTVLRGACIHHDNGILGACAYPEAEERKIRLLKEAGYNAVRSAHNPCSKALLDACDRLGMLVMDEYADMWYVHKTPFDYASVLPDWWERDLEDLVGKDFNHPSVVIYSLGNEVGESSQKRGAELGKRMADALRRLDPARPVTCGVNLWFNAMYRMGFGQYTDKKALRQKGKRKAVGSELFNELTAKLGAGFMKRMAELPVCDRATRDVFSALDIAGYNYGCRRYLHDIKKYPGRVIVGTETFVFDACAFWECAKDHPALIGDFVWAGMDYLGECAVGAMEYRAYADDFTGGFGWMSAGSGRLDLTGRGGGEMLYTKVAFDLLPIAMASVPANFAKEKHSPTAWGMTNARASWSWEGAEGRKTTVEVYTKESVVALYCNGKLVGKKKRGRDCRVCFRVAYRAGTLIAVGLDGEGRERCRTSLSSAGKETMLRLEPEGTPRMGKLCFVRLRYTDAMGETKPTARGEIAISVEGGEIVGFGNGCPFNRRGYLEHTSDTYFGEALAVIRATSEVLTLSASCPFGPASLTLRVSS